MHVGPNQVVDEEVVRFSHEMDLSKYNDNSEESESITEANTDTEVQFQK